MFWDIDDVGEELWGDENYSNIPEDCELTELEPLESLAEFDSDECGTMYHRVVHINEDGEWDIVE